MANGDKRDRTARLLKVQLVLSQNSNGLHPKQIARLCQVSVRTTYRDLEALDAELGIPLWHEGRCYGIVEGYFLPPVKLTIPEAVALFISARLVSKYADGRDPNVESAFIKLASVLPAPVGAHIQETVVAMANLREDSRFVRVFGILSDAWAKGVSVDIWYPHTNPDGSAEVLKRRLDPYFIEPSGTGHSCYVIGFDHYRRQVRTFKIERIQDLELTGENFDLPPNWSAREHLRGKWGIAGGPEVEIQVRFSKKVASRVKESVWHETQTLADEPDGTLLFTVRVSGTMEITPWLLSWGNEAEVLAPTELRRQFAEIAHRQAANYASIPVQSSLPHG